VSVLAILGSGFGLYGYLPALAGELGQRVILPERYRDRLRARPELAHLGDRVDWATDDSDALDRADGAVLALPPAIQVERIDACVARRSITRLVLEKPLAPSPADARAVFDALLASGKVFRIGYTFRFTDWGAGLLGEIATAGQRGRLSIYWDFLAHHFRHDLRNWKRASGTGGGAIRFYGIQLIALLAEAGYREVAGSRSQGQRPDEIEKWAATFGGPGLPECNVVVDTNSSTSRFRVEWETTADAGAPVVFADLADPFGSGRDKMPPGMPDNRVPLLGRLCRSLWDPDAGEMAWYRAAIALWAAVEKRDEFVPD